MIFSADELKLKAAQEVSENLEVSFFQIMRTISNTIPCPSFTHVTLSLQTIVSSQHYPNFLETAIPIFVQLLKDGKYWLHIEVYNYVAWSAT